MQSSETVNELHETLEDGAYEVLEDTPEARFRFKGEVCMECNESLEDIVDEGGHVVGAGNDSQADCCLECWYTSGPCMTTYQYIPLFWAPTAENCDWFGEHYCQYCGGDLQGQTAWFTQDEDGYVACDECYLAWARGEYQDESYAEPEYDDELCCAWCGTEVAGEPHVTDSDGEIYCMECWCLEEEESYEPPKKTARVDDKAADDAAGRARNDRDKAKLRARYKDHCAYHLFHAHHRRHQGCTFAAAGQDRCSRGSHRVPDDFEDAQAELETPARA